MPTLASRHLITVWVFIGLNGSWAYISLCDILILLPFVGLLRITLDIYCIALYNKHIKTINNKGRNKMNISKTTTNFAEARGLSVYIDEDTSTLWIGADNEDIGEDMCCYFANDNGTFTWKGNVWLPRTTKEELPATIRNEKHLREVIDFISKDAAVIQELAA